MKNLSRVSRFFAQKNNFEVQNLSTLTTTSHDDTVRKPIKVSRIQPEVKAFCLAPPQPVEEYAHLEQNS